MDKEKYVRNLLLLWCLCAQLSTCHLQKEMCTREFDLLCITGRNSRCVSQNTSEVFIIIPELADDVGVAGQKGGQDACDVGERVSACNSSLHKHVPVRQLTMFLGSRPTTSHLSTAHPTYSCGHDHEQSQAFCQQEISQSILQWDISVFNNSAADSVVKDKDILFQTVETLNPASPSSKTPIISLTGEEFYRNSSDCSVGDIVGEIILHQNYQALKRQLKDTTLPGLINPENALNKRYLDYFSYAKNVSIVETKPSGNFSTIKTGLDNAKDKYLSNVPTLHHISLAVDQFENVSHSKCIECLHIPITHVEAVVGDDELDHSKDEVNFLHLSLTLENDINHVDQNRSRRSIQMCDSDETQDIQGNNSLQYYIIVKEVHENFEILFTEITSESLLTNRSEQECQDENDDMTNNQLPLESDSYEPSEHHSLRRMRFNAWQNHLLVNVSTQCVPSDRVLETISKISDHTQNLDENCSNCEHNLPLHFSVDQCWNKTIQSRDLHYNLVSNPSASELSLSHVQSAGKENGSRIMECPNDHHRNLEVNTRKHQTCEAEPGSNCTAQVHHDEGSSYFLYTSGKQCKFMQTHEVTSRFPAKSYHKVGGYQCEKPSDAYSLANCTEQCENFRLTSDDSQNVTEGEAEPSDQFSTQKDDSVDENTDASQHNEKPAADERTMKETGQAGDEVPDARRAEVEADVGMAWSLKVLVYSCSLLVSVWSLYGAAHLYRFYLEQRRMLSPRTPTNSYESSGFPFHSDSMQAIVDAIKGDREATTSGGIFPTTPKCSPIKQPRCSTPKPLREKFQQLLHADRCLGDRVELYAADNIRSMVRYDPGLGMKLWPHFKHNTRRYVGRTVQDRKITQYAEKKLQSRMLTDYAFQEDVFSYIEKHVWPEVRRQARLSVGEWQDGRLDLRCREVMRGEALSYLTARFSTILWHDGLLEREIMSHVEQTRHGSMQHLH